MKKYLLSIPLFFLSLAASADEGMWLVNAINQALEQKMQAEGLELSAGEIYDESTDQSLTNAIVSLDFMCSGSVVSNDGLVITNHHCAYSDVYGLSTPEHNYLEDGYWAFYRKEEIPIKGKRIQFIQKILDVTAEVDALKQEYEREGKLLGSRKLYYLIEKKYEQETGLEASLGGMWAGEKYYLALYKTYTDIRLVAAPPVSIAAFGGDIDNWEWPQHKGDFALYRIYTAPDGSPAEYSEDNVPLKPSRKLSISTQGYKEGDFSMVIGFPGRTERYSSSAKICSEETITKPITVETCAKEMAILRRHMDSDPKVRLLYSDRFFGLSNMQECYEGEVECCKRFDAHGEKCLVEDELQQWIDSDPERSAKWGDLLDKLRDKWSADDKLLRNAEYARESLVRASKFGIFCLRLKSKTRQGDMSADYESIDLDTEKDLFKYAVNSFYKNVDNEYWGPYHKELWEQSGGDSEAIGEYIAEHSILTDTTRMRCLGCGNCVADDPMFRFYTDINVADFNKKIAALEGEQSRSDLEREYIHALYQMREDKLIPQAPDANSSMRITYGKVGGVEPRDAVVCDYKTSTKGILEKYDPQSYDFNLKPYWKEIVGSYDGPVDFLTDNDITGGNSGSPVMNSRGELIGLAFDGNKEGLASNVSFTKGYNKCVCVDIRYVLYILKAHGMDAVLSELL